MMNQSAKVIPLPIEEQTVTVKRSYLERLENLLLHATWENVELRRAYDKAARGNGYMAPDGTMAM